MSAVFYLFAACLLLSATLTIVVRQPVHAVLCLIWSFLNAAGLFLTLQAEFLAFVLLIVYIGAVAVLFLFVVMMLDTKGKTKETPHRSFVPVGLGLGTALLIQMGAVATTWPAPIATEAQEFAVGSAAALGRVLYTTYLYPFQVCGLILLVAMVGAIVLTLRSRSVAKRQNARAQIDRARCDVVEIRSVKTGEGIEP